MASGPVYIIRACLHGLSGGSHRWKDYFAHSQKQWRNSGPLRMLPAKCCLKNQLSILVVFCFLLLCFFIYFSHILLFIWLSGCIFFNSHSTHRADGTRMKLVDNNFGFLYLVQSSDHCSQCIYNDKVESLYTYRPIHHVMECEGEKKTYSIFFFFIVSFDLLWHIGTWHV